MDRNYIHYENDGKKWIWYPHSWTYGKDDVGKWSVRKYYSTNSDGEGVFIIDLVRGERKQILGTCQFSLNGLKDPRRAIRRWMND